MAAILLTGLAVAGTLSSLPFQTRAPLAGLGLYALAAVIVLARLGRFHPHPRFGVANAITLARAGGAVILAALALEPALVDEAAARTAAVAVAGLLALDGVDGTAARKQGLGSSFGARFDMEVDAGLILVLTALVFALGKAGPWMLGIGLLRYGFVLAGRLRPALRRPLSPSRRRSAVCGLQVAVLGLLLLPAIAPPISTALAAIALGALVASFAVDTAALLARQ